MLNLNLDKCLKMIEFHRFSYRNSEEAKSKAVNMSQNWRLPVLMCCTLLTGDGGSFGGGGGSGLTTILGNVRELPAAIVVFFLRRLACCRKACLMTFLLCTMLE